MGPLAIAVLVKQVPSVDAFELTSEGRMRREGVALEMNAYCRRAVSKGAELAGLTGGRSSVFTLAPPQGESVLLEAMAWGVTDGYLVSDKAFAGSDTLATSATLASALTLVGPFDVILAGRNSIDADTGQVPVELAEMLNLPFVGSVRELTIDGDSLVLRSERDDGWRLVRVRPPLVVSAAERLCAPCKVDEGARLAVPKERIRVIGAAELGDGPWGASGSQTVVRCIQRIEVNRRRILLQGTTKVDIAAAVDLLVEWGSISREAGYDRLSKDSRPASSSWPAKDGPALTQGECKVRNRYVGSGSGGTIAVVLEPGRERLAAEMLGLAARIGRERGYRIVAVTGPSIGPSTGELEWSVGEPLSPVGAPAAGHDRADWVTRLSVYGADHLVYLENAVLEESFAEQLIVWLDSTRPLAVLAPSTAWGREVAGRAAASLGAGLTGDAIDARIEDDRLICMKPAFGGSLVAEVEAISSIQMVTVRPGTQTPIAADYQGEEIRLPVERVVGGLSGRLEILDWAVDDNLEQLVESTSLICLGAGVHPTEYALIEPLRDLVKAEFVCSRKVADQQWQPRSRQVGVTGRNVTPKLYVAIGLRGSSNHMVGVRGAGTILAINKDRMAPVFDWSDVGLVGDWHIIVPAMTSALEKVLGP